ncbi:MAG TPA: hypothetical protein VNB94_08125 [Mycobacteriales bacterium]|nr:hypothetical protein [Mycobacteriales bacterium]
MRRAIIGLVVGGLALVGAPAQAVEGCVTSNPGPGSDPVGVVKCTYTASTVGSIGASGTWKVTVVTPPPKAKPGQKKAKPKTRTYQGASPAPVQLLDVIAPGETVTAESLMPGTVAAVGNPAP